MNTVGDRMSNNNAPAATPVASPGSTASPSPSVTPTAAPTAPGPVGAAGSAVGATASSGTDQGHASIPAANPATTVQKVALFVFLLTLASLLLAVTYQAIDRYNREVNAEVETSWELPPGARLKIGHAGLRHDPESKTLKHRGPLDAQRQLQLRDLLEFADGTQANVPTSGEKAGAVSAKVASGTMSAGMPTGRASDAAVAAASAVAAARAAAASAASSASIALEGTLSAEARISALRTYHAAIDALAYESIARQAVQIQLLLLLGMCGGALGAVLRSLVDYVGHACYTGQLDLHRWWPLYATRPLVGAMLGFLLVVLFKAKLLTSTSVSASDDSFWWLGLAAIGGFSTVDVTLRLRLAAKALFGVHSSDGKSS